MDAQRKARIESALKQQKLSNENLEDISTAAINDNKEATTESQLRTQLKALKAAIPRSGFTPHPQEQNLHIANLGKLIQIHLAKNLPKLACPP